MFLAHPSGVHDLFLRAVSGEHALADVHPCGNARTVGPGQFRRLSLREQHSFWPNMPLNTESGALYPQRAHEVERLPLHTPL